MEGIFEREVQLCLQICSPAWPGSAATSAESEQVAEAAYSAQEVPQVFNPELLSTSERAGSARLRNS